MPYDTIILGLGAMGSSALYHLARAGRSVLGIEQFAVPHSQGSSHGHSRMIRLCYFEHPDYVPLLRRAYELWRDLEHESGRELLRITGGLYLGRASGAGAELVPGSLRSARRHGLDHEELTRAQVADRFPQFHIPDDYAGMFEPTAGALNPEAVVATHADLALRHGAHILAHTPVLGWQADGDLVLVRTPAGEHRARNLVLCAGAWSGPALRDLGIAFRATRQILGWVWPKRPALFERGAMPVWAVEPPEGVGAGEFYGFPMMPDWGGPGFKLALHKAGPAINPGPTGAAAISPVPADESSFRPALSRYFPDADGPLLALRACMYENSPDSHFIIDRHPATPNVILAAGFSGHGFKFASVIGEVLADLSTAGGTRHPIGFLGLQRFGSRNSEI